MPKLYVIERTEYEDFQAISDSILRNELAKWIDTVLIKSRSVVKVVTAYDSGILSGWLIPVWDRTSRILFLFVQPVVSILSS